MREGKIIFLFESLSQITRFLKRKRSCAGGEEKKIAIKINFITIF